MPNKVELKQNSKTWYEWRGKGLGASEAGTVMGVSDWETPFELWAYKTGILKKPEFNSFAKDAMDRGTKMEPEARAFFEGKLGLEFPAISYEHDGYPFIRASLDGHNVASNTILEIKCPGKTSFAKAKKGNIPDNYYAQMQQQMLVTGATLTHYGVYYKENDFSAADYVIIPVAADPDYQAMLQDRLIDFWKCVDKRIPPQVDATDLSRLVERIKKESEKLFSALEALAVLNSAFTQNHFGIGGE